MNRERLNSAAAPMVIAALVLLLPVGAYVAGYFLLGEERALTIGPGRVFPSEEIAGFYDSAGEVESWIRGEPVTIGWTEWD